MSTLPTRTELKCLSKRGLVAYAVLCARRVQPLYQRDPEYEFPDNHNQSADIALNSAADVADGGKSIKEGVVRMTVLATRAGHGRLLAKLGSQLDALPQINAAYAARESVGFAATVAQYAMAKHIPAAKALPSAPAHIVARLSDMDPTQANTRWGPMKGFVLLH